MRGACMGRLDSTGAIVLNYFNLRLLDVISACDKYVNVFIC